MGKSAFSLFIAGIALLPVSAFAQKYNIDFGKVTAEDLAIAPHKIDPGADAVILSHKGVASLNYISGNFYIDLEVNTKIKIINSDGFDYANIAIPLPSSAELRNYRASVYNLRNGTRTETRVTKQEFIIEKISKAWNAFKFAAPDVHEGSVIEYAYQLKLPEELLFSIIPWEFQQEIPVVFSSFTFSYPEFFRYKNFISGDARLVKLSGSVKKQYLGGQEYDAITSSWYAENVPALTSEPYSKGLSDNQTKLTFELGSVLFPGFNLQEVTPTFKTINEKLLKREDFGMELSKTSFLRQDAIEITRGLTDDLSKLKAVYKYVSEKIFWDGNEDFTSSSSLKSVYNKQKGNSADINMILIGMLRNLNIKADPVILSTRSNGTLNQYSAMVQQFNYLVARVVAGGETYLVDATDPLRPFNQLPLECLNGKGWLVNQYEAGFIELKNNEENSTSLNLTISLDSAGKAEGNFSRRNSGYAALKIRETIKLEGEEGYAELVMYNSPGNIISDFKLINLSVPDSDIVETGKITTELPATRSGNRFFINPFFSFAETENIFSSHERLTGVDFGCPVREQHTVSIKIPRGLKVDEVPDNVSYTIGKDDAVYRFTCSLKGDVLYIKSLMHIKKISFQPAEYSALRNFFTRIVSSRGRLIILSQN